MNRFTILERNRLVAFLTVGRRNAINARAIAAHMGFPLGGNQVKTRSLIRECIELEGDLIGSTLTNPKGFFLFDRNNIVDFEQHIDSLENRAAEIIRRRNNLIRNWNTTPLNQTAKPILNVI